MWLTSWALVSALTALNNTSVGGGVCTVITAVLEEYIEESTKGMLRMEIIRRLNW